MRDPALSLFGSFHSILLATRTGQTKVQVPLTAWTRLKSRISKCRPASPLIIIWRGERPPVVQEVRGVQRCADHLERQGCLAIVEAVRKIVGIGIRIAQGGKSKGLFY